MISIEALKALAANGATVDMIIAVVEADLVAHQKRIEERRAKDAERQREWRARNPRHAVSRGVTVTNRDKSEENSVDEGRTAENSQSTEAQAEMSRGVTVTNRDKSEEKEKSLTKKEKELPSQKENPPKGGQKKKGFPLLDGQPATSDIAEILAPPARPMRLADWMHRHGLETIPQDWGDWATSDADVRMTELEVNQQWDRFSDYWKARAGPEAKKMDWEATWRNWCRTFRTDEERKLKQQQQRRYS